MGYGSASILLYGVKINEEIAQKISEKFSEEDLEVVFTTPETAIFRKLGDYFSEKGKIQKTPISPYSGHQEGSEYDEIFYGQMLADGTDSRSDDLSFTPGSDHYLGIYIASKGYGHQDNLKEFLKQTPVEAVNNFKALIQPILDEHSINEEPSLQIVTQVW